MKKLIALFALALFTSFAFVSCNLGDDNYPNYSYEFLPAETVTFPDTVRVNQNNDIIVTYIKPTDCHFVEGFYYDINGMTRTVAIQSRVLIDSNCQELTATPTPVTLKFAPTAAGEYLFKFYAGRDAQGQNIFDEYEVVVTP